jgi:hypothetical protein
MEEPLVSILGVVGFAIIIGFICLILMARDHVRAWLLAKRKPIKYTETIEQHGSTTFTTRKTSFEYLKTTPCIFCPNKPNQLVTVRTTAFTLTGSKEEALNLPCCSHCKSKYESFVKFSYLGLIIAGLVLCWFICKRQLNPSHHLAQVQLSAPEVLRQ